MRKKKTFNNFFKENKASKIPMRQDVVEVDVPLVQTENEIIKYTKPLVDFSGISLPINNKLDSVALSVIRGKSVIIVNPEYMDLTKSYGREIDQYDVVIRINHLPTVEKQNILGVKCDMLYLDDNHNSLLEQLKHNPVYKNIKHIRSKTYISLPSITTKCSYWSNYKKTTKLFNGKISNFIYIIEEIISFKPNTITLSKFILSKITEPITATYLEDKIKKSVIWNTIIPKYNPSPTPVVPTITSPRVNQYVQPNNFIHNNNDRMLYEYVRDKNVIIVGPAPINQGTGLGKIIDQYDIVIKTNGGVDNLPVEDYGTRCDILYMNIFFSISKNNLNIYDKKNIKYIRSKANKKGKNSNIKFSNWSNLQQINNKYSTNILSGLYIVEEMLNWGVKSLTITGMDFYETNEPYVKNYLPNNFNYDGQKSNQIHDYKKHAEIFKQYINDGVIKNLNDKQQKPINLLFEGHVKINPITRSVNNGLINIHIAIPTYNRPYLLLKLLNQIYSYSEYYNLSVYIYDDASTEDYSVIFDFMKQCDGMGVQFKQNSHNLGKKLYSMVYNNIFYDIKNSIADYYIQIPDDIDLVDDFFNRSINSITKTSEDVISILICKFQYKKMTNKNITEIHNNEYYASNWVDGAYIARKSFFDKIGYSIDIVNPLRWVNNTQRGSGTGGEIRKKYTKRPIYQLTKSLIIHEGLNHSVMCGSKRDLDYSSILSISDMIKNRRVIFVGPSPTIIDNGSNFGKFIDDFDVIIRTNGSYPIPQHLQPYMGTITDILSLNKAFQTSDNFKGISYNQSDISYFYDMGSLYNKTTNLSNILNNVLFFDKNNIERIKQRINENDVQPFGGMVIIEEILKYEPKELYVVGVSNYSDANPHFDGYLPNNLNPEDIKERQDRFHKNGSYHQSLYFNNLLNNNLIKMDKISIKNFK